MASDRGLPAIPRGLGRELTIYLQGIHGVLARLSGLARNSQDIRAVRVSEDRGGGSGAVAAVIATGSILTRHLGKGVVTSEKLADGSVTEKKLGQSAVTEKALKAGSVTTDILASGAVHTDKLADKSVSVEKLADGLLPTTTRGEAADGETVTLAGVWAEKPAVWVSGFFLPTLPAGAGVRVDVADLRRGEGGVWIFDAVARFVPREDYAPDENPDGGPSGEVSEGEAIRGRLFWIASGRQIHA